MSLRAVVLTAGLVLAACGTNAPIDASQVGPSPIVLKDTSPGQLSVTVVVNMVGYDEASRGKALLDVNFQHDGRPVQFVAGERVACGSSLKAYARGAFESEFALDGIAGRLLHCTYSSGAQTAALVLGIPPALAIVAPADHQTVNRSRQTVVRYSGATGTELWFVALSPSVKAVANPRDISATAATIDTSTLGSGAGSISLTDANNIPLTSVQAAAFQSATGTARRMTSVAVTWT